MKYCCAKLKREIEEKDPLIDYKEILKYDKQRRYYAIVCDEKKKVDLPMDYCPFCGKKFPENLCEKFEEVLCEEYGPEYLTSTGKTIFDTIPAAKSLPSEFQTDEWWKKRGL